MKKICLLFACAGLFTFAANAQERKTKEPVKVAPVERAAPVSKPAPVQKNTPVVENHTVAETTPHSDIQPTTKPVAKGTPVKRTPVKYKRAQAVAVPATKAGAAK